MEENYFAMFEKKLGMRQLEKLDGKSHGERIQQFNQHLENDVSTATREVGTR